MVFDLGDPTIVSTCVMFLAVSLTYMIIGIILIFIGESKKDSIDESSQKTEESTYTQERTNCKRCSCLLTEQISAYGHQ